jgi:hypothetical protein
VCLCVFIEIVRLNEGQERFQLVED